MATILDTHHRKQLLRRLSGIQRGSRPHWGSMDAHKMLCHLSDLLRVAVGEKGTTDSSNVATRTFVKWAVLYLPIPVPKGKVKAEPEMLSTQPSAWQEDLDAVGKLLDRLADFSSSPRHPVFGPLSHPQWCRLASIHIDHHLNQFGL